MKSKITVGSKGNLLKEQTELEEFHELSEEFKKRFGRRAYIAEPGGTVGQAIKAVKQCFEKNQDILDEIYRK